MQRHIVGFCVLRRALSRQVRLAAAVLLCAAVVAGCASGVAQGRGSAAGAVASGSAPAAGPRVHPARTPVPPPVRGNIHQKVRAVTVTTRRPVPLRAVAHFGTGVTARIRSVRAIECHAMGPGQVSGPGLRLVIQVHNGTAKQIHLDNAVVTIADARGTPGVEMNGPGSCSHPMQGVLAPGHQASGTYVFTIPAGHRDPVTVNFSYAGGGPVVLFRGDAA